MAKRTPEIEGIIEQAIRRGLSNKRAAEVAGIDESTFYDWMADPEFSKCIKKARAHKIEYLLDLVRVAGVGQKRVQCPHCGKSHVVDLPTKNWQSLAWILERTEREEFHLKSKTEHELPPGSTGGIVFYMPDNGRDGMMPVLAGNETKPMTKQRAAKKGTAKTAYRAKMPSPSRAARQTQDEEGR